MSQLVTIKKNFITRTLNFGSNLNSVNIYLTGLGFVPDEIIVKSISYLESNTVGAANQFGFIRQLWSNLISSGVLCTFVKSPTYLDGGGVVTTEGTQMNLEIIFTNDAKAQIDNRSFNFQIQSLSSGSIGPGSLLTQPVALNWSVMIEFKKYLD